MIIIIIIIIKTTTTTMKSSNAKRQYCYISLWIVQQKWITTSNEPLIWLTETTAVTTGQPAFKASFVSRCMKTRLMAQKNEKWSSSLVYVSRPLVLKAKLLACICVQIQIFGWNAQSNWNARQKWLQIFNYRLAKMPKIFCFSWTCQAIWTYLPEYD